MLATVRAERRVDVEEFAAGARVTWIAVSTTSNREVGARYRGGSSSPGPLVDPWKNPPPPGSACRPEAGLFAVVAGVVHGRGN
jgi:hypothetical protein